MKTRFSSIILFALALVVTSGCSSVGVRNPGEVVQVNIGTVIDKRVVRLAGRNSGAGALIGSTVGVVAASQRFGDRISSGGGVARWIAGTVISQTAGAIAGAMVERKVTESDGLELTIRYENGNEVAIPQRTEDVGTIDIGDTVRVRQSGDKATIEKVNQQSV